MSESNSNKAAFVTGASRGIGAETAKALARNGYDIALGYRDPKKEKRINSVVDYIQTLGCNAIAVRGDITNDEGVFSIQKALINWKPLNALILNAAGGLEKDRVDADPSYALKVNRDAQILLLDGLMHQLIKDSSVVFVTSHWSHKYGEVELPPFDYNPIASSKHLGELALRDKQEELSAVGSRLVVATAGLVTETFVGDAAIRRFPDFAQQQQDMGNVVPAGHVGERIVRIIEDLGLSSGHTEWIGADEVTFMRQSRLKV